MYLPRTLVNTLALLVSAIVGSSTAEAQDRPAFEVASVKPTTMPEAGFGTERVIARPGILVMSNARLRTCIQWAYGIGDYQIAGPAPVGDPYDYRELRRFEITAKAAPGTPLDAMRLMLRTLLAERFNLTAHREARPMSAWILTLGAGPHKLRRPADPDGEFKAIPTPSDLTLRNATLDEFGNLISGPLRFPVLNRTGLVDRFDFRLDLSGYPVPSETEYLFARAIQEQLGLKVEKQKVEIEMLIVDHVDKQSSEN